VLLAWGSALRLRECLALNVDQLLDLTDPRPWRLRSTAYLRPEQSKSRRAGARQWEGGGTFVLSKAARVALRAYLRAAESRGWIAWPPPPDVPLFITARGGGASRRAGQLRLLRRAAQYQWVALCKRASVSQPYRFHDLRHDALTRVAEATNGDPFKVAAFGRFQSMDTALRYVHHSPIALADLATAADL
jgi:integrase